MNQDEQDNNRRSSTIEEIAMMLTDLRGCRKNAGITLREVEEKTGISNAYLSQLETGKITNPSYKEVVLPLYQLYFNVQHPRVVLHEQNNKPERTAMQEALIRAKGMHEIYVNYSKQPENRPGTSNFDVCQAEKEVSRMYVSMIEQIAKEPHEMNDAILFSYWLMEHCELEEDNSLWSYDGEDYTNERLYEIYLNQKYPNHGK